MSSNAETVFVKSRTPVALTMAADKSEICTGDSIIFTATGTGGGDTPQYMWLLNNTILPTKSPVLKLNALKNKDRVKAVLTSSENCTVKNPVESHVLTIIVNEPAMPSVDLAISKIMVCKGERIVFETTGQHLGVTPQYQWLRNGKSLNWESNSYATDSLRIDDAISVVVKSSNTCTLDRIATSKIVTPFVHICLFGKEYSDQQVLVYPNPSTQPQITVGLVNLKGTVQIDILTQRGQVIFTKIVQNVERDKEVHVEFSDMPDGLYIVRVRNGDFTTYKKWLIAK